MVCGAERARKRNAASLGVAAVAASPGIEGVDSPSLLV
jgi:hypothetical protein